MEKNQIVMSYDREADVARKQGYTKVEIIIEKAYESWFKELSFKQWEPQTEYEKLIGKSDEGYF